MIFVCLFVVFGQANYVIIDDIDANWAPIEKKKKKKKKSNNR